MLPIALKRGGLVARPHAWSPWSGLDGLCWDLERFFAWGVPDWFDNPAYPGGLDNVAGLVLSKGISISFGITRKSGLVQERSVFENDVDSR